MAALSSLDLTSALTEKAKDDRSAATRSQDPVVADRDQKVKPLKLEPGQRVVGRGVPLGTVYRLTDGRTVIVKEK